MLMAIIPIAENAVIFSVIGPLVNASGLVGKGEHIDSSVDRQRTLAYLAIKHVFAVLSFFYRARDSRLSMLLKQDISFARKPPGSIAGFRLSFGKRRTGHAFPRQSIRHSQESGDVSIMTV